MLNTGTSEKKYKRRFVFFYEKRNDRVYAACGVLQTQPFLIAKQRINSLCMKDLPFEPADKNKN
jgi:hypothetical protein